MSKIILPSREEMQDLFEIFDNFEISDIFDSENLESENLESLENFENFEGSDNKNNKNNKKESEPVKEKDDFFEKFFDKVSNGFPTEEELREFYKRTGRNYESILAKVQAQRTHKPTEEEREEKKAILAAQRKADEEFQKERQKYLEENKEAIAQRKEAEKAERIKKNRSIAKTINPTFENGTSFHVLVESPTLEDLTAATELLHKVSKLKERKEMQIALTDYYAEHNSEKKQIRYCECGTFVQYLLDENKENPKIHRGNFCQIRLCPMCMHRKARKDAIKISTVMDAIEAVHKKAFIFVTLTAPNVPADKLSQEISKFNRAFRYLTEKVPAVTRMNDGYVRKLEITYNAKRDDYHTHFHVIFAVEPWYFTSRQYLSQKKWLDLWRKVMKDDSITQVDVRRVYRAKLEGDSDIAGGAAADSGGSDKDSTVTVVSAGTSGGAFEIGKYVAKSTDFAYSQKVFDAYLTALHRRRMIVTSGLFSVFFKMYDKKQLTEYQDKDETYYKFLTSLNWKRDKRNYEQLQTLTLDRDGNVIKKPFSDSVKSANGGDSVKTVIQTFSVSGVSDVTE